MQYDLLAGTASQSLPTTDRSLQRHLGVFCQEFQAPPSLLSSSMRKQRKGVAVILLLPGSLPHPTSGWHQPMIRFHEKEFATFTGINNAKPTNRRRDSSAGGRYGGRGALSRNPAANVEKPRIMFPTISRRSLFTGTIKSCRTLCKHINHNCFFAHILLYLPYTLKKKYVITTKKSAVETPTILLL